MRATTFSRGAAVAVVTITLVTVLGELALPIKDALASLAGHHWIGKGILGALAFVLGGPAWPRHEGATAGSEARERPYALPLVVVLCTLVLAAFFLAHYESH